MRLHISSVIIVNQFNNELYDLCFICQTVNKFNNELYDLCVSFAKLWTSLMTNCIAFVFQVPYREPV